MLTPPLNGYTENKTLVSQNNTDNKLHYEYEK